VDLSQAFSTPNHNLLFEVLLNAGVSGQFVAVFQNIYDKAFARVRMGTDVSNPINITKGVLQGEPASPSLFNLFLEDLKTKFEVRFIDGLKLGKEKVHFPYYADDLLILAHSPETLQQKIQIVANFFHSRRLVVNLQKTKIIIFRKKGPLVKADKFFWRGSPVEIVKDYMYLGVIFTFSGMSLRTPV